MKEILASNPLKLSREVGSSGHIKYNPLCKFKKIHTNSQSFTNESIFDTPKNKS